MDLSRDGDVQAAASSQGMAAMETKAHLELLHARGRVAREETDGGVRFTAAP